MHLYKMYNICIFITRKVSTHLITMQLTKQTDFAFRVLLFLSRLPAGDLTNIRDICGFYDISHNHIAKVVVKLTKLGYVESIRGHGGGIRLAKGPIEINLAQVIEDFETTLDPVNCMAPPCKIVPNCELKRLLFEASNAFLKSMRSYSLADLILEPQSNNISLAVEIS